MEVLNLNSDKDNSTGPEIDLSDYKDPVTIEPEVPGKSPIIDMGIPADFNPDEFKEREAQPHTPESDQETWEGNKDYFQSGPKKGQRRQRKPRTKMTYTGAYEESEISADIITGAMFISLIDLLLPMAFATANNYFTGEKIKPSDLSLTAEQCRKLEPIADKAMSYIKLRGNPMIILGLTLLGMYSMALVKAKMEAKVKRMNDPGEKDGKTSGQYTPEKK